MTRGLIGEEQCCSFSLEEITKSDYHRAVLGNYLINVCTENPPRVGMEIFKKMASRETLQARHPHGRPFPLHEYATPIFAMNELPKNGGATDAFYRRLLIIRFGVRIPDDEQVPDLAKTIVEKEMSGVLSRNRIIVQ